MNLNELLDELSKRHVKLWTDGDHLRLRAPKGVLTPKLRDLVAECKAEIVSSLRQRNMATSNSSIPLVPVPRNGALPLSFAQAGLWFVQQSLNPNRFFSNIFTGLRLIGSLNVAALEKTFNEIVRRHEALRTTFATVEEQPIQVIASELALPLLEVDLSELPETERNKHAQCLANEEFKRPFDLSQGPLIRTTLLIMGEQDYILLLTTNHIVFDGWSLGVFTQETRVLYEAFSAGKPSPLRELPIQYADFVHWQRQLLQGEVLETLLAYWKKQLKGAPLVLKLPIDKPRPPVRTFNGAYQPFILSTHLSEALKALSRQEGVTLFMTLLAAFQALLHHYTDQDDICVGSPIANRKRIEFEGLIGYCNNFLVLRTDLSGNPTFRELLARVREVALGAYAHQDLPFRMLKDFLQPESDQSYGRLCQVMFSLHNFPMQPLALSGLKTSSIQFDIGITKLDLEIIMVDRANEVTGILEYNTDLFESSTIARMLKYFQTLLESIVVNPELRI